MDLHRPSTKIAEDMFRKPEGATMAESRGLPAVRSSIFDESEEARLHHKKGQGREYNSILCHSAGLQSFEAKVTDQGQGTVPNEVRVHLKLHRGGKVNFAIEKSGRVVINAKQSSILDLVG